LADLLDHCGDFGQDACYQGLAFVDRFDGLAEHPLAVDEYGGVAAAGSNRQIIYSYLDFEVSYGRIDDDSPWNVDLSTIPFRENHRLGGGLSARHSADRDRISIAFDGEYESWSIIESNLDAADLITLFNK